MTKKNQDKIVEETQEPNAILDKLKDSEAFFEKNKKVITIVTGGVFLIIAGFFGYKFLQNQNNESAQAEMYNAVFAWEKDSLKRALDGDKNDKGLVELADEYSGTDAGNLANYYAGVAFLKQGKFDEAIEHLSNFSSDDYLLQGLVYSLIGDAYLEKKEYENAVNYYSKAADYNPNEGFTPRYLMKLALAHELNNDFEAALAAYNKVITEFPKSNLVNDAKKYKAKSEGLAAGK